MPFADLQPCPTALLREEPAAYAVVDPNSSAAYCAHLAALQDPDFRAMPGFSFASDEAILALSDPPAYTACPNPFLPEMLATAYSSAELSSPECTG